MSKKSKNPKRAKAKKDLGIAVLPNGVRIAEATRDELQKHHWQGPRREKADSAENWTTQECKDRGFSGFRANVLVGDMEVWILGHIERTIPLSTCTPDRIATLHEEVFATRGTLAEVVEHAPVAIERKW